jgi:hypothetical protein
MRQFNAKEFKVVCLRECPLPGELSLCDTPEKSVEYFRAHVATADSFNPEVETMVVLLLNTRRKIKGHVLVWFPPAHSTRFFATRARCSALLLWPVLRQLF